MLAIMISKYLLSTYLNEVWWLIGNSTSQLDIKYLPGVLSDLLECSHYR